MRLLIFYSSESRSAATAAVVVQCVFWLLDGHTTLKGSLSLILALVRHHSCFSFSAVRRVNLQQNEPRIKVRDVKASTLVDLSPVAHTLARCSSPVTFPLSPCHVRATPCCYYLVLQQWNNGTALRGSRAATAHILAAECLRIPLIIHSRFPQPVNLFTTDHRVPVQW